MQAQAVVCQFQILHFKVGLRARLLGTDAHPPPEAAKLAQDASAMSCTRRHDHQCMEGY